MKPKYYCILFIFLFALSCCKKNNSTPPSVFTESSFPLAVGDWWQYQFTDNYLGGAIDTYMLRVDSVAAEGPYTKYICNYIGNGPINPAGYFLQSDTSMSFVQPYGYNTVFPNFHFKFPVETGQKWQGAFPGDSIRVAGIGDSCGGYGQDFGPCFSTVESYTLPHNFKDEGMFLTPKIGLIEQHISFSSDTAEGGIQIQQSITLLSYHVQ